ncbi:MAG: hypothetical protein AMXMBFR84_14550 [Candidatus Hydrogenedentota bacterium]
MSKTRRLIRVAAAIVLLCGVIQAAGQEFRPLERTVSFRGIKRSYFVALPDRYDPQKSYWPLVFIHGGAGNVQTNSKAIAMREIADKEGLPAILILPEFVTKDKQVSRFPELGEADFLLEVMNEAHKEFRLHDKLLLAGYSMGGQCAHRFALAHPDQVMACAPSAAGTWTTPDGRFLVEDYGEVKDPAKFLTDNSNKSAIPDRLHDLFDPRVAAVAGTPAAKGAKSVPFLIMCGTLDSRYSIAVEFAASLQARGFTVETEWPVTPHGSNSSQYKAEFRKYSERAVQFFNRIVNAKE